jgi:predicted DNA-binding transcriptional regulator AlpA
VSAARERRPDDDTVLPTRYLTPQDLSVLLGVPIRTIYQWRCDRTGPAGFRVGKYLRYDPAEVRAWIESLKVA